MDRYLYTDTHEAIISDEMFMAVQQEKLTRALWNSVRSFRFKPVALSEKILTFSQLGFPKINWV